MSVISLSSLDEFKARTLGSFVAVVKYELPGCAVCDRVRPMYAQFPSAFPAAVWCETSSSEIAKQQNVEAFPSFDLFRRGVKVMRITGGDELGSLQFAVTELLRAKVMPLTEEVFLLDWQPNREQLLILKGQTKAKTLINLRHPTEKGYVSAKEEAEIAGIENYAEVGIVDVQDITPAYLSEACEAINKAEKPVVVHCLVGLTAVLVGCVNEAKKRGNSTLEVGKWAADFGPFNLSSMSRVVDAINKYLQNSNDEEKKKTKDSDEGKKKKDKKTKDKKEKSKDKKKNKEKKKKNKK